MGDDIERLVAAMDKAAEKLRTGDHGDVFIGDLIPVVVSLTAALANAVSELAKRVNASERGEG